MRNRIIFDIILLGAIFYMPWWVVAPLAFIGVFLWPMYYEIILFGLLADILYGAHSSFFGGIVGILGAISIFLVASYAKKIVR